MPSSGDLYTVPAGEVNYELVRDFVVSAEDASLFSESLTLEVKEKLSKGNVAEAVAALSQHRRRHRPRRRPRRILRASPSYGCCCRQEAQQAQSGSAESETGEGAGEHSA